MAQSDERLVLQPWEEREIFGGGGSVMVFNENHMDGNSGGMHLTQVESSSRVRFTTKYPVSPALGYDYTLLSMSGRHEPVPAQLTDVSLGFGSPFMETNGWFFMAGAGFGYAGDTAFGDGKSWYGMGWLATGRELDKTSQILILVDYNGNRRWFPDVPIPGIIFHKTVNDRFEFTLGPIMEAIWKPTDKLTLDVRYDVPDSVDALVKYDLNRAWNFYAHFENRRYAFHDEELPADRRLFFLQDRVEGGIHFSPKKWCTLTAAIGYAFDQEFRTGWDERTLHHVADISDAGYLRFGIELNF
jgi:hypothetical protein